MVNYHTSTLLESSEHVFGLIRYNFFGGAPPYPGASLRSQWRRSACAPRARARVSCNIAHTLSCAAECANAVEYKCCFPRVSS